MTQEDVFILNPAAGARDQTAHWVRRIEAHGQIPPERRKIEITRYKGHAQEIAAFYARRGGVTLWAGGGDGTLSEVVTGLAGAKNCKIAALPIGTGNDFIKCFGTGSREKFLELDSMFNGDEIAVDAIKVEDRLSLNIVSIGFDAAVAEGAQKYKRLPFAGGKLSYYLSLAENFVSKPATKCAVVVDGQHIAAQDYLFVVVANGRWYGGGFLASPNSSISDGKIDLIRIPALPRLKMLSMMGDYKRGEHLKKYSFISQTECSEIIFTDEHPINVNIDGDIFAFKNPSIRILPSAVRLVVPKGLETAHLGSAK